MPPLISVIIPSYNHETFIETAIASVLKQSVTDFELLVIDDGSSDATLERLGRFEDSRITILTQENRGAAATLNRGLELARGEYVSILNSDDCYHSERFQALLARLEAPSGGDLVFSRVNIINGKGEPGTAAWLERGLGYFRKSEDFFSAVIRDNFVCTTSNLFFRRKFLEKTGPFFPLRYCHDLDFILQAESVGEICFCDQVLLDYRVHDENTIKEMDTGGSELFKFEVAAVIAFALARKGISMRKAPFFLDGLLTTQMGALLDLVALLLCFFNEKRDFDRDTFSSLLMDGAAPLKIELLKFIGERDAELQHPWTLYYETLARYKEDIATLNRVLEDTRAYLETRLVRIEELSRTVQVQFEQLSEYKVDFAKQREELSTLTTILNEIYSSRGWLWLTRYRRLRARLQNFGKIFR